MAVKNPQFGINLRKNDNQYNAGYGQYYPKAQERETISLDGLTKHMADHNSIYGDDVIGGVLKKMSSCIIELLSQEEDPTFSIFSDQSVPVGEVVQIMNIAKRNHFKVILATQPE